MNPAVLVLENDRGTRKLLEALLGRLGLEVDAVASAADAVLLLERVDYDFVFADPDVLAWLETHRPETLERSVVLSAMSPLQLDELRERWPRVRTIRKPFDLTDVVVLGQAVARDDPRRGNSIAAEFARRSVRAGAKSGMVLGVTEGGAAPVTWYGYAPGVVESFLPIPLDSPMPMCVAMRRARPVWIASSRSAGEFSQFEAIWERFDTGAVAAIPLLRGEVVLGAAAWSFRAPQHFDEPQQQALLAIAESLSETLQTAVRSTA